MLLPLTGAAATASLSIEPFDIKAGETKEMFIDLTNPDIDITLVQFDLRLPAGLSLKQTGGEYDIDIAGRTTWRKHSLDANRQADGTIRFLLASSSNAMLSGYSGAIISMTFTAGSTFSSGDIRLENILMVSPNEEELRQDTYIYTIGKQEPAGTATLSIEPFSITAGGEAQMLIDLNNPDDEITLVQFDLRLPAGLTLKKNADGEYDFDIAGRTTWRKHSLDANPQTDGTIRFLLASSSNMIISGTSDAIIKMTLMADGGFQSGTIRLENILLVTPEEKEIKPANAERDIAPQSSAMLSIEPFGITMGETKEMFIDLTNPEDDITLVQFDLSLPRGLSLKQTGGEYDFDIAGRTTWRKHSLDANAQNDGTIRFLLASSSNAVLSGTDGAIIKMTLVADNSYNNGGVMLKNILLVTPDEKEIKPADVVLSPTGIYGITFDSPMDSQVFSLSGQRLTAPKKGINIVGGKKVVVK